MGKRVTEEEKARIIIIRKRRIDNDFRASIGLPLIKIGEVPCLRCGEPFFSDDVASTRICGPCNEINSRKAVNDQNLYW